LMLPPAKHPSTLFMLDQPPISHFWVWIWSDDKRGAVIVFFCTLGIQLLYTLCTAAHQILPCKPAPPQPA
jgi:hypothetical protein